MIKHAGGENTRGKKREEKNHLSTYFSLACLLFRAACSVVSAFSERHAFSPWTEDRRCFKFQIKLYYKFIMKQHLKHTKDYHRRQSWTPSVKTLDFTIRICSTPIFIYFDLYLNTAYAANVYLQVRLSYNYNLNRKRTKYYSIN